MEVTQTSPFLRLPPELLLNVLSYLEPFDLARTAQTSKALNGHSCDDFLWQPIVSQQMPYANNEQCPLDSYREVFVAHHPHWFLARHRIWFSDSVPSGKLLIARYESDTGCISAYTVTARKGRSTLQFWEKDRDVVIHSFDPEISLDLNRPVVRLQTDSQSRSASSPTQTDIQGSAARAHYNAEIMMDTFAEPGLYTAFMHCRALPEAAISESTHVWPPLRFQAKARTRNMSGDDFKSSGHRPNALSEISQYNFRVRKWVEYARRERPTSRSTSAPANGLLAALDSFAPFFAARFGSDGPGGVSFRIPEDINTYATLPETCYMPTAAKPYQGIWCGDYSAHGCEFLLITQPDKEDERPLPEKMNWLRRWFSGETPGRRGSASHVLHAPDVNLIGVPGGFDSDSEPEDDHDEANDTEATAGPSKQADPTVTDYQNVPSGRLEAIKLTGDPNVPRGEFSFISPDIGPDGFIRVADEEIFRGARVVRSAGHVAWHDFNNDQYSPSQLILISHDRLAQFWERMGHISFYRRVDLDALTSLQRTANTEATQ